MNLEVNEWDGRIWMSSSTAGGGRDMEGYSSNGGSVGAVGGDRHRDWGSGYYVLLNFNNWIFIEFGYLLGRINGGFVGVAGGELETVAIGGYRGRVESLWFTK